MTLPLSIKFEKAVCLLTKYMASSDEHSRKPILFHSIRVGVYLYENGYPADVVLAGLLHDTVEWSDITEQMLKDEFGGNVAELVLANTKDRTIEDKQQRVTELVQRCIAAGQAALIVKAADTLDSFKWYTAQKNVSELDYCLSNAHAILKLKPTSFDDKIFTELKNWMNDHV